MEIDQMGKINPGARLVLWLRHLYYSGKDRKTFPYYRNIAEHAQPRPVAYIVIRNLYDSLRYVYDVGGKVFSWESRHNFVLMTPPRFQEPYTGALQLSGFVVVTDNDRYANLLRQKFTGCSYRRVHRAHVLGAPRFASLKEYLEFLSFIASFEKDYFLGERPLEESLSALRSLCDSEENAAAAARQLEVGSGAPPEGRLAIDVDTLNSAVRRQDSWI